MTVNDASVKSDSHTNPESRRPGPESRVPIPSPESRAALMPAYLIVEVRVTKPEPYAAYRDLATASVARHGGRFLVRGGAVTPLEGDWRPERFVVIEFASVEAAKAFYFSDDYQEALQVRLANSVGRSFIVEGYSPPV